jgi:hypothetical protein
VRRSATIDLVPHLRLVGFTTQTGCPINANALAGIVYDAHISERL